MSTPKVAVWWEPPHPELSHGYNHVLVSHHKHGNYDFQISFGKIVPYDNYKKYKVFIYVPVLGGEWQAIPKRDILSIGHFTQFGYLNENNSG